MVDTTPKGGIGPCVAAFARRTLTAEVGERGCESWPAQRPLL